jgi:hypothetical protein
VNNEMMTSAKNMAVEGTAFYKAFNNIVFGVSSF